MPYLALFEVIAIAAALSVDCFAAAVALGAGSKPAQTLRKAVTVGLVFSIMQTFLAFLGVLLGSSARSLFANVDHWLAFLILGAIGFKMIASFGEDNASKGGNGLFSIAGLAVIAFGTSLDAFAVGISLAFLPLQLLNTLVVLVLVTFAFSAAGVLFGGKAGQAVGRPAQVAGGLCLIAIGTIILLQHLSG